MKKIILLTNSIDGLHTDSVMNSLSQSEKEVIRIDFDLISSGMIPFSYEVENGNYVLYYDEIRIVDKDVISVWNRRPKLSAAHIKDAIQRNHVELEWASFLSNLEATMDVFWVNRPSNALFAENKLLQLKVAKKIGFEAPNYLVTNNPKTALQFHEKNGDIVFKILNNGHLKVVDDNYVVRTTLLNKTHFDNIDLIKFQPAYFQEYIHKEYELRITVVGNKIFANKIDSQKFETTSVDWRVPEKIHSLGYEPILLPENLCNQILVLMDKLNLSYGAIDMVVEKETGRYVFIEINPNGQWYWIERYSGSKISDALAELLMSKQ